MMRIALNPNSFFQFFSYSLLAHLFILSFFYFKKKSFLKKDIIIQSAVRVDLVGLPEKIKNKSPKTKKAPSFKKRKKIKKSRKTRKESLFEAKAFSKLKKINQKKESREPLKKESYFGNKVNKASDLKGFAKVDYDNYFQKLKSHVRSFWEIPQWLDDQKFSAKVLVRINSKGSVLSYDFIKRSSHSSFDQAVLNCLMRSSPFPEPTDKIKSFIEDVGIEFEFP